MAAATTIVSVVSVPAPEKQPSCCFIGDDAFVHVDCKSPHGLGKCCVLLPTRCCATPYKVCAVDWNPLRWLIGDWSCGVCHCCPCGLYCVPCFPNMKILDIYATYGKAGLTTENRAGAMATGASDAPPAVVLMQV
jgi:hypothetical protein